MNEIEKKKSEIIKIHIIILKNYYEFKTNILDDLRI